jgi:Zn-dependent membrane protease YugP
MMKINSQLYQHYLSRLKDIATTLTRDSSSPINILEICNEMNISINVDSTSYKKAVLSSSNDKVSILLSKNYYDSLNIPFVRYIIAHEIGHYLLQWHLQLSSSHKDYWVIEELCDAFSRALLVPDQLVSKYIDHDTCDLHEIGISCFKISNEFNVTFITSVQRVKDYIQNLLFINLKSSRNSTAFKVNKSLLLKNKYLNSTVELPRNFLIKHLQNKRRTVLFLPQDEIFKSLETKYPLFFNKENRVFLILLRPSDISFMTINYAQQNV